VCALAHYLEDEGIATLTIGLIPQHVAKMEPPRALTVPFQLGRPLGAPGDAEFQRDVLKRVFGLLNRPGPGPVSEVFERDAPDAAEPEESWACPVSFPLSGDGESVLDRVLAEVRLLRPWFDRGLQRRGRTAFGTSGMDITDVCVFLNEVAAGKAADPGGDVPQGDRFKLAAEDLKMFYVEAAMEQPNPGSSRRVQDWFWNETAAGEFLFGLRDTCKEHVDPLVRNHARFTLVPAERLSAAKEK
jgi:hypothetical protein